MTRGGSRAGSGRKPIGPQKVKFLVSMTEAQRDKVKRLGGAAWVRTMIDSAIDPKNNLPKPSTSAKKALKTAHTTK